MSTTSPHSYSNYFSGSVFFSRDPLCIRYLWVREVGSGARLVWHAWFGEERSRFVVLSGMSRAGHHPHTRHAPRHTLSQSSCEHSLVSRFLFVVSLISCLWCMSCLLCCPVLLLSCFCPLSVLSCLCLFLCLSVRVSVSVPVCV